MLTSISWKHRVSQHMLKNIKKCSDHFVSCINSAENIILCQLNFILYVRYRALISRKKMYTLPQRQGRITDSNIWHPHLEVGCKPKLFDTNQPCGVPHMQAVKRLSRVSMHKYIKYITALVGFTACDDKVFTKCEPLFTDMINCKDCRFTSND